ncbi:MAG TPA: ribokinase [Segeticoccus sp.]|uniref:ribokinase n=1 Tax=Segeticoccus sp. TaxID=2706531 RepID=UPI002D7EC7D7|nr:ribokinase [Segeticoccus sp.]HET8599429.1 ribokinase [Segeticoccus sp.]
MGRVVVVGSLNVDHVTRVERHPEPGETVLGESAGRLAGGKGANQAMAARAAGAEVGVVGCVGQDEDGRAYLDRLAAAGVDTAALRSTTAPTGRAIITVDEAGENTIIVVPGANAELTADDLAVLDELGPDDVVLLQLEIPLPVVERAVRRAGEAGARVVVNVSPYAPLAPEVVALVDLAVVNEHEALALADSGLVPKSVLVTFGAAGAAWDGIRADGVPVPDGEVVDTTGAGDAFCGALAAALAAGADRAEALQRALQAGADAVRHEGAQPDGRL